MGSWLWTYLFRCLDLVAPCIEPYPFQFLCVLSRSLFPFLSLVSSPTWLPHIANCANIDSSGTRGEERKWRWLRRGNTFPDP